MTLSAVPVSTSEPGNATVPLRDAAPEDVPVSAVAVAATEPSDETVSNAVLFPHTHSASEEGGPGSSRQSPDAAATRPLPPPETIIATPFPSYVQMVCCAVFWHPPGVPPPPLVHPPPPPCPSPPPLVHPPSGGGGGGVTWPMNNKKLMGNHRRRRKFLVGDTRIQVFVVWCPSPPPPGLGGNRRPCGVDGRGGGGGQESPAPAQIVQRGPCISRNACGNLHRQCAVLANSVFYCMTRMY